MSDKRPIPEEFRALASKMDALHEEMSAFLPQVAEARRNYFRFRTAESERELERAEGRAVELHARYKAVLGQLEKASGIPEEALGRLDRDRISGDAEARLDRGDLTKDKVAPTASIDELLPKALEAVLQRLNPNWADAGDDGQHRLDEIRSNEPLSLVRGTRPKSERLTTHRFLQTIRVARDFLSGHPEYDHFGGALLVPQLTMLGVMMPFLEGVGGDVEERLTALWRGPSIQSDSVLYELLVAAGCAEKGRRIEFIEASSDKSPDLRAHDPFPLLIECKRKRSLSDYELTEEAAMRTLFDALYTAASDKGVWGRFELDLSVEAVKMPMGDIVRALILQRLAAKPERTLAYPWGSIAYVELPRRGRLPRKTRTYSPNMLMTAFRWDSDLPQWDGIICSIDNEGEAMIDEVACPIALVWTNRSEQAIRKRSWSPTNIFADATSQITPGGLLPVPWTLS